MYGFRQHSDSDFRSHKYYKLRIFTVNYYYKQLKLQKMENAKVTGKIIGGILIGTLLGAVLGILFAPQDGNKTRDKLSTGAKDMTDDLVKKIKTKANNVASKAEELGNKAEAKVKSHVE